MADSRPGIGTRALGLSGAFISNAEGSTGALWNPAGLASLRQGSLVYDLSQGAVSVAYPTSRYGTLGFSLVDLNGADRFFIKDPNNPIGTFEFGNNQAIFSYAGEVGRWQIGGNVGYSRAPYQGSQWKPSYDLGVVAELNSQWAVGASLRDISGVVITDGDGKVLQRFEQQLAIGGTWSPIRHFQLNNGFNLTTWEMGIGAEVGAYGAAFRLGSIFDFDALKQSPHWSLGLTLSQWSKQVHYAYLARSDLDSKHFISIGWTFGGIRQRGNPPPRHIDWKESEVSDSDENVHVFSPSQLAEQYDVELELILAVVRVESSFNPEAISSSGAVGLMQLMPPTARDLCLRVPEYQNLLEPRHDPQVDERFNPRKNLRAGVEYLEILLERYNGNNVLAVAAYNVGPGNVQEDVPVPQIAEQHVGKVLKHYYEYKADTALRDADLARLETLLDSGG